MKEVAIILINLIHLNLILCQNDTDPILLFSNINQLALLHPDSTFSLVAEEIPRAIAIDFHKTNGYVYWSDVSVQRISRIKYPADVNATAEVIIDENIQTPDGLAVDSTNDHLYWTDTGIDMVLRSDLDGTNRITILDTELDEPRAIVLDVENSWMYLSDWGASPKIEKCKLDGRSRQTIVSDDLMWPNGLALDSTEEKIYWVDGGLTQIKSANLDGTNVVLIVKESSWFPHPFDIEAYGSYLYYTDWRLNGIARVSKLPGSEPVMITPQPISPMGLKIYTSTEIGDFPTEAFAISVATSREDGTTTWVYQGTQTVNVEPVFKCQFQDVIGKTYLYDITWYINGNTVKRFEKVLFSNIHTTWLRPHHWVDNYKMNMYVKCSVQARHQEDGDISPNQYSAYFVAGVIPNGYRHEVNEGGNITIKLKSTVPIGCHSRLFLQNCLEVFKISYPKFTKNTDSCSGQVEQGDIALEKETCGLAISAANWDDEYDVVVHGYVDSSYNMNNIRTTEIHLTHQRSLKDWSKAWASIEIPSIQIRIKDQDTNIELSKCESWSDPRYYTFDRKYFSKAISGEYVLYRNKRNKYWVVLPSGTEIWFRIGKGISGFNGYWVWHITIKPSTLDIDQTEGLCGYLSRDGDQNDDFQERGTGNIVDEETFIKSWFIQENSVESLFSPDPKLLDEEYLKPFCICEQVQQESQGLLDNFNEVKCNLSQPLEKCINTTTNLESSFYSTCSNSRQKREVWNDKNGLRRIVKRSSEDEDDITEESVLTYNADFIPQFMRPDPMWKNGWTEEIARETCSNAFDSNSELTTCKGYIYLSTEDYINACVEDIKATGNTTLMKLTVDKILAACIIELFRNETLTNETDSSGETVVKQVSKQLCQDGCNEHGSCIEGVCECQTGFSGPSCSDVINPILTGLTIPNDGRCQSNERQCTHTNVYGDFETDDVWFKRRYFKIVGGVIQESEAAEVEKAEVKNPYMIRCDLGRLRRKRALDNSFIAEGYYLSFSTDGTSFGEEIVFIIYDENCYSCNTTTLSCTILVSCPHTSSNADSKSDSKLGIIVGVLVAFILIIAVGIILLIYNLKTKKVAVEDCKREDSTCINFFETVKTTNIAPAKTPFQQTDLINRQKTGIEKLSFGEDAIRTESEVDIKMSGSQFI